MIDIGAVISALAPNASWSLDDNDYSTLVWWSPEIPVPTYEEILQKAPEVEAQRVRNQVRANRAAAYAAESDPIFFKAQRGEATMDDWRTAVAAIQLSFPYPNEEVI